jgi:glycosyl transferase, family 25
VAEPPIAPSRQETTQARQMTSQSNPSVNELFPHKACINLDRDRDSWERMQVRLTHHDIRGVNRVSAIDGSRLKLPTEWRHSAGAYGCLLSHLQVVRDARRLCWPSVLVLEDDTEFDPCFSEKFPVFVKDLPADWDMIFFGALHREDPIPVSDNVYRIRQAYSTYAYALRNTIFDAFVAANQTSENPVDVNNSELQSRYKCYCFMPNLAWVETRYSHVQERMADHWYLRESVVTLGSGMDRILERTVVIIAHDNSDGGTEGAQNPTFLASFYQQFLEGIRTCVVEQGPRGAVNPSELPVGCRYLLLDGARASDRNRCFAAGLECAPADCDYVIFSDSHIFVDALSIRANLRMCERYDCATGLKCTVDLTAAQTEHVRCHKLARGIDLDSSRMPAEQTPFASYGLFRRDVLEGHGARLDDILTKIKRDRTSKGDRPLRVFASPNHALRLHGSS